MQRATADTKTNEYGCSIEVMLNDYMDYMRYKIAEEHVAQVDMRRKLS